MRRFFMQIVQGIVCSLLLCTVSGCYTAPVRHLAADVGLVKVGSSSKEDVLAFLGKPDQQREKDAGTCEWIYRESRKNVVEKLPLLGERMGAAEEVSVVVGFHGDTVSSVEYSAVDPDDLRWRQPSGGE